jgi:hypothetical protein
MRNKWERRDNKEQAKRRFRADNRVGVRNIQNILKVKADKIKGAK